MIGGKSICAHKSQGPNEVDFLCIQMTRYEIEKIRVKQMFKVLSKKKKSKQNKFNFENGSSNTTRGLQEYGEHFLEDLLQS